MGCIPLHTQELFSEGFTFFYHAIVPEAQVPQTPIFEHHQKSKNLVAAMKDEISGESDQTASGKQHNI